MSESQYKLNFNKDKTRQHLQQVLSQPVTDGIILVSESNGDVTGMIIGISTSTMFSDTPIAAEIAWFVKSEYRRSRAGIMLFSAFEYWAKNIAKADKIQVSSLNVLNDSVNKFYLKTGYNHSESAFLKEL